MILRSSIGKKYEKLIDCEHNPINIILLYAIAFSIILLYAIAINTILLYAITGALVMFVIATLNLIFCGHDAIYYYAVTLPK